MTLNYELTMVDWWVCQCGNEPDKDGFYSCMPDGRIVEPTLEGPWNGVSFLCYQCGCIYDCNTLDETGIATDEMMKSNYQRDWSQLTQ